MVSRSQCDKILRHMKDFGTIDSLTAMSEYGIMRLASRISDLKRSGHNIRSEIRCGTNRYGEKTHYSVYQLVKEDMNA